MKITDALRTEHTVFLAVFDQFERVLPELSTAAQVQTFSTVIEGLLRGHAEREANLAYLALDHVLADNGELRRMYQDHHEIDERLKQIAKAKSCAEASRLLKAGISACREHFKLEEQSLFPLLEKTLQPETLAALGRSWVERPVQQEATR